MMADDDSYSDFQLYSASGQLYDDFSIQAIAWVINWPIQIMWYWMKQRSRQYERGLYLWKPFVKSN